MSRILSVLGRGLVLLSSATALAQSNAVPLVNEPLIPASSQPGSKGFTLTVNGAGFAATAVVNWNGSARPTKMISPNQLKALISASDVAKASTAWVTVTNPSPGGGTSNVIFFPIHTSSPTIAMAGKQVFSSCTAAVVGDFNNDGKLDVAWFNGTALNVSLGDGKGGFQAPIANNVFNAPDFEMITGDFNGDGKLDLAGMNSAGTAAVFLGNGDGTFTLSWRSPGSEPNNFIAAADFNRDGKLDLYITGWDLGQQWFRIYPGNGDGTFSPGQSYSLGSFAGYPAIGDFNGDGKLDLAIPQGISSDIAVFLGNGDGTFNQVTGATSSVAEYAVVPTDMNGDGKLDLITDGGCILIGKGDGTFPTANCTGFGTGPVIGLGDFNGDGNLDAAANLGPAAVWLGTGGGTFNESLQFAAGAATGSIGNGLGGIGDFNNDGKLDVIMGNGFLLLQTTISVTPNSIAFGNQDVGTSSQPQAVTVTNIGASTVPVKIAITGNGARSYGETNNCGISLPANSSCQIQVTFTPVKAGSLLATLWVSYGAVGSSQVVSLSGTGVVP